MGNSPPRPCQRCGRINRGRCEVCKRRREQTNDRLRPSASARGYDAKWAAFAKEWLDTHPFCGQRNDGQIHVDHSLCAASGLRAPAQCVDHIQSLRSGGRRFDRSNLQSLCSNCNRRKNIKHEGGFGRPTP